MKSDASRSGDDPVRQDGNEPNESGLVACKMLCSVGATMELQVIRRSLLYDTGRYRMQRSLDPEVRLSARIPRSAAPTVLFGSLLYAAVTLSLTVSAARVDTFAADLILIDWVQRVSLPGVEWMVISLNWVGSAVPLISLVSLGSLLLIMLRRYMEAALLASTIFVHLVNFLLKAMAASPRPSADVVRVTDPSSGFGFPSGHTMAFAVTCGMAVYIAWRMCGRRSVRYGAIFVALGGILGMGFSRVYSGAHWPTDVIGAYLWSMFYLTVLIGGGYWVSRALQRPFGRSAV